MSSYLQSVCGSPSRVSLPQWSKLNCICFVCFFSSKSTSAVMWVQTHSDTNRTDRHSWGYRGRNDRGAIWCQQMELIKGWEERRGEAANQDEKTKCLWAILKALISLCIPSASALRRAHLMLNFVVEEILLYVSVTQDMYSLSSKPDSED